MAITQHGDRIHIDNLEDAVAVVAALNTKHIAALGAPGHDLETVAQRLTTDRALEAICADISRRVDRGEDVVTAMREAGGDLTAAYRRRYGI